MYNTQIWTGEEGSEIVQVQVERGRSLHRYRQGRTNIKQIWEGAWVKHYTDMGIDVGWHRQVHEDEQSLPRYEHIGVDVHYTDMTWGALS